jgi:hypothetical protein
MVTRKRRKPAVEISRLDHRAHGRALQKTPPQRKAPASKKGARSLTTAPDTHGDRQAAFMKALGVTNPGFVDGLFNQILNAVDRSGDKFDLEQILFSCAVLRGAKPRGELESMHIVQMTVVHATLMRSAADFAHAENLAQRDSAMRAMNQLARTYTAQLEALKDYRSGAEPEVTVVSVTDRGQTTVDRVSQPTTRSKAAPDRLSLKAA